MTGHPWQGALLAVCWYAGKACIYLAALAALLWFVGEVV